MKPRLQRTTEIKLKALGGGKFRFQHKMTTGRPIGGYDAVVEQEFECNAEEVIRNIVHKLRISPQAAMDAAIAMKRHDDDDNGV